MNTIDHPNSRSSRAARKQARKLSRVWDGVWTGTSVLGLALILIGGFGWLITEVLYPDPMTASDVVVEPVANEWNTSGLRLDEMTRAQRLDDFTVSQLELDGKEPDGAQPAEYYVALDISDADVTTALTTPCVNEDTGNCFWDADNFGNGQGMSFVDLNGEVYYGDVVNLAKNLGLVPVQ